jgi:hypothetical protein
MGRDVVAAENLFEHGAECRASRFWEMVEEEFSFVQ